MDKTNRALIGMEDNARAISELTALIKNLRARADDNALSLQELSKTVKTIKTAVDSNAQDISDIVDFLNSMSPTAEIGFLVVTGGLVSGQNKSTFGTFKINGPTVVLATTRTGNPPPLMFGDTTVCSSILPMIGTLEQGENELYFKTMVTLPRALLIGDFEQVVAP